MKKPNGRFVTWKYDSEGNKIFAKDFGMRAFFVYTRKPKDKDDSK
jgi:hypothetical protein